MQKVTYVRLSSCTIFGEKILEICMLNNAKISYGLCCHLPDSERRKFGLM